VAPQASKIRKPSKPKHRDDGEFVDVERAEMKDARLDGANIEGADMREAKGLSATQLTSARNSGSAPLPAG
jgi:uncharacterized protein YjbI with pentapeptide repeats